MEFNDYKTKIKVIKSQGGQYWTNIVGSLLVEAATKLGPEEANRLIDECKLEKNGW